MAFRGLPMHSQLNSSMADLHPGAVTITESPTQSPRASIASHALQILVWLVIHLIHPSNPLDLWQVGKNEHVMTGRSRISLEMDPMCGPSWEPSFRTRASIHQGALATCAQHWKANLKQLELGTETVWWGYGCNNVGIRKATATRSYREVTNFSKIKKSMTNSNLDKWAHALNEGAFPRMFSQLIPSEINRLTQASW